MCFLPCVMVLWKTFKLSGGYNFYHYYLCQIFISGFSTYLSSVHNVNFPPNQHWFCAIATAVLWAAGLSSTLFILSMTFDRFYSIIRPHKAASFNTVKRAKVTIVSISIFSTIFNIPPLFVITNAGRECVPDLSNLGKTLYFWLNYVVQFVIPFLMLLIMNGTIIHIIRTRSILKTECNGKGHDQGQSQTNKIKSSERQIFAILLLVSFSFFILIRSTPLYAFIVYSMVVDYTRSPYDFAVFYLFYNVMHKMFYTNNAINFLLYVISGKRFRTDLINLFRCKIDKGSADNSAELQTKSTILETVWIFDISRCSGFNWPTSFRATDQFVYYECESLFTKSW